MSLSIQNKDYGMMEKVSYRGKIYSRDPNSKYLSHRRYFRRKRYDRMTRKYKWELLHRVIWESHYGRIPLDCVIHHINGDWNDNRIENLECIKERDHLHRCNHYRSQPKERVSIDI